MEEKDVVSRNFIEQEIDKDLQNGVYKNIATRFPPEPNGYLHIGHAKSILLNYGTAEKYRGTFNLRFDDTNPVKEDTEFVDAIRKDVEWICGNISIDNVYFASDYFDEIRDQIIQLIREGDGRDGRKLFDFIMVTKYLERIGDHATNIAEWVEFAITGVHKDSAVMH